MPPGRTAFRHPSPGPRLARRTVPPPRRTTGLPTRQEILTVAGARAGTVPRRLQQAPATRTATAPATRTATLGRTPMTRCPRLRAATATARPICPRLRAATATARPIPSTRPPGAAAGTVTGPRATHSRTTARSGGARRRKHPSRTAWRRFPSFRAGQIAGPHRRLATGIRPRSVTGTRRSSVTGTRVRTTAPSAWPSPSPARCRPARCRPARCRAARCRLARCRAARCRPARGSAGRTSGPSRRTGTTLRRVGRRAGTAGAGSFPGSGTPAPGGAGAGGSGAG